MSNRNHYRYNLKQSHKVVYKGITKNPENREEQHKDEGKRFSNMQIVGPSVTKAAAEKWEEESLAQYRSNHGGRNPRYNETDK